MPIPSDSGVDSRRDTSDAAVDRPADEILDDAGSDADSRRYASLAQALAAHRVPTENHELIRAFTTAIGIAAYYERGSYIKAERIDAGPPLFINYGWTNGFESEDEVRRATGQGAECWPSGRGRGQWGVSHPVHRMHGGGGGGAKPDKPDYGTCPSCHLKLPATRRCDDCD